MKRREFVKNLGLGVAGAFALPPLPPLPREERFVERWSWAMGQPVHIMLFAESEDAGLEACAAALAELRRVEARLTLFDDASDLCELNRVRTLRVCDDLRTVLAAAERYRQESGGSFNAAIEPLMRAWGFHRPLEGPPSPAEITEAREAVAAAVVQLDGDRVRLPSAHTQLDFGGIGVGYGIDRAVAVLRAHGVRRAFIDVSGDCYGLGAPPGEPEGWRVDIAGTTRTVRLRDAAVATSANSVTRHVMDPRTGYPVDSRRQVTITARTAIAADALSTAALITGS